MEAEKSQIFQKEFQFFLFFWGEKGETYTKQQKQQKKSKEKASRWFCFPFSAEKK